MSVRSLARLIGRMTATAQAILPAPLYYRSLQHLKNQVFRQAGSFETMLTLNEPAKQELHWWEKEVMSWNGKSLTIADSDIVIETDASLLGWGAHCRGVATGGLWSPQERGLHINILELIGGTFAVKTFAKELSGLHIRLRMDNSTSIAYINHMGGTRSPTLAAYAKQLWTWCLERNITISAEHLPGVLNITADRESRTIQSSVEWMLDPAKFRALDRRLGQLRVDVFATRLYNQLSNYISLRPDPFAIATDALQVPWREMQGYAFPPFSLVGRN